MPPRAGDLLLPNPSSWERFIRGGRNFDSFVAAGSSIPIVWACDSAGFHPSPDLPARGLAILTRILQEPIDFDVVETASFTRATRNAIGGRRPRVGGLPPENVACFPGGRPE